MNKIKEEHHKALNVAEELSVHLEGLEILAKLPQEVASLLSLLPTLFDQWVIKSRGLTHTTIPFSCVMTFLHCASSNVLACAKLYCLQLVHFSALCVFKCEPC